MEVSGENEGEAERSLMYLFLFFVVWELRGVHLSGYMESTYTYVCTRLFLCREVLDLLDFMSIHDLASDAEGVAGKTYSPHHTSASVYRRPRSSSYLRMFLSLSILCAVRT